MTPRLRLAARRSNTEDKSFGRPERHRRRDRLGQFGEFTASQTVAPAFHFALPGAYAEWRSEIGDGFGLAMSGST